MKKIKAVTAVLFTTIAMLATTAPASQAHEPKRIDCVKYGKMHSLVVGSPAAERPAFLKCWEKAKAHILSHPLPDSMIPWTLRRIRECESGGNYTAQNRVSTASGAYQYLDTTWGGHLGYAKARLAPPRVQDRRAIRDFNKVGGTPWAASQHCWG